jgi:putative peptidoglycan lipid II flippase
LALANSVAISIEVLALLLVLRRRLGGLEGRRILAAIARIAGATVLMALAVLGVLALGRSFELRALWLLLLGAGAGGAAYVGAGLLFGVEALRWPLDALRRLRR